mmetsp:Transcript_25947/g.54810  ORF Transcript_25947/g.54810 Transcript_25947/m.54810 type:complete len:552 (+) Transcript_25947:141-1796(+)
MIAQPPPAVVTETTHLVNSAPRTDSSRSSNRNERVLHLSPPTEDVGETLCAGGGGNGDEEPFPTSTITTVFISVLLGLVSGSLYGFGRYARALKHVLHISQSQVQQFGIWLDCGNYIGHPLTGMAYDRHGPTISCLLAALIVFSSYATIHFIVRGKQQSEGQDGDVDTIPYHEMLLLKLAFAGVGFGSGLGYISGLGSTTKQFLLHPKYLGRAVGLVAAGYGSAATLVGLTYRWFGLQHGSSSHFFLFWAIGVAVVNLVAAYMFRASRHHQQLEREEEGASIDGDNLLQQPLLEEANGPVPANYADSEERGSHAALSVDQMEHSLQSGNNSVKKEWKSWKDSSFWLLFFSFACITGCGLFVINNLSTMAQSIGAPNEFAGTLIITLSGSNVAGRIIMGALGDVTNGGSSGNSSKLFLLQMASVVMAVALLLFGMLSPFPGHERVSLTFVVILVAMAYGGSWVVVVAILADLFGKDNFGKDYGLMAMGPALSGMIFNSVSAWFYEQHTVSGSNSVCVGVKCYQAAYGLTGISALVGCVLLQFLIRKRRRQQI